MGVWLPKDLNDESLIRWRMQSLTICATHTNSELHSEFNSEFCCSVQYSAALTLTLILTVNPNPSPH